MPVQVDEGVHEVVVAQHPAVFPQRLRQLAAGVLLQDQEPGELGQLRLQQLPASRPQHRGDIARVAAEQQLHVLAAQPAFPDEQLVHGVPGQLEPLGRLVIQGHVQPGQELGLGRDRGREPGGVPAQRAASGRGVPGQHVQQAADRGQPVLIGDLVPVMRRAVAQPLDIAQRLDHRMAADVRPAPVDQVLERLPGRGARHVMMTPQLLEQPLGDLPDPGDRVLRVPVAQRLDRPLEVQAQVTGDPRVIV